MSDSVQYCDQLQKKLLELRELVEANIVESAAQQKQFYHSGKDIRLAVGQEVLVSNPTRGKLNPRWTGPWIVQKQIDVTSVRVKMGTREQVVHMNRIRPLLLEDTSPPETLTWKPPLFTQDDEPPEEETDSDSPANSNVNPPLERTTRSGRVVRPVDYYGYN